MSSRVPLWPAFKRWTALGGVCLVVAFHATNPAAAVDMRQAARMAVPAVVAVEWLLESGEEAGEASSPSLAMASGTVLSSDGLVVTCYLGEGTPAVMFADGRSLPARVLVDDERSNLLLLKVEASDVPALEIAKKAPALAQGILAVVGRGKTERAVAQGIVTATGGALPDIRHEILETDVVVGAMSAGSPVVASEGQLIGIVVGAKSTEARHPGPAVLIPAKYVQMLLDARSGDERVVVRRGYLGVSIAYREGPGALIASVMDDSPASDAGILKGDVIKTIDGNAVSMPDDVIVQIGKRRETETVLVTLDRTGQPQEIEVTLAAIPGKFARPRPTPKRADAGDFRLSPPQGVPRESSGSVSNLFEKRYPPRPATRVGRSDTEKALKELGEEMKTLREQLKDIQEVLNGLQERLEKE